MPIQYRISAKSRRGTTTTSIATIISAIAVCAAVFAPVAGAASGGTSFQVRPIIKKVACVKDCSGRKGDRVARGGSTIRIVGDDLKSATKFVFLGSNGKSDDTTTTALKATQRVATVKIPADSASGRMVALTANGQKSKGAPYVTILPPPPVIGSPELKSVPTGSREITLEAGASTPRTVFLGAKELVRYSVRLRGAKDAKVNIALLRASTGESVAKWTLPAPDGETVSVDWNGELDGTAAAPGRYAFTVAINVDIASLSALKPSAVVESRDAFDVYPYIFPIRGKYDFGERGARFGGGRGHQGQDIMSPCGTKLVAARGGTVVESRFQSAAGNFIVIRPDAPGVGDQAYLHMARRSAFRKGDRVYTGQQIGPVGTTGRSSACHLHFEQWTGEIWRSRPLDMYAKLKSWALIN